MSPGAVPHVTLYHGKLKDVPIAVVASLVDRIRQLLLGHKFVLSEVVGFGGNFIFWNLSEVGSDIKQLQSAHEIALELAQYLDPTALPKATTEEALTLSEEQKENVRRFGHPLVRNLFLPHITLGFHPGVANVKPPISTEEATLTVASVEFVRIGHPGRVEEVLKIE